MEALVFVTETVLSSVPVGMLCECVCFCTRVITLPHTHLCRKASTHKGMSTLRMKENFYRYKLIFLAFLPEKISILHNELLFCLTKEMLNEMKVCKEYS